MMLPRFLFTLALAAGFACPSLAQEESKKSPTEKKPAETKPVKSEKVSMKKKAAEGSDDGLHPRVRFETTLGEFVIELNAEKAPISVQNFLQYVEEDFYDGTIFHRVMDNFMIQGGGFTKDMDKKTEGLNPAIKNEWQNGLSNEKYTIAMARMGNQPDSATSQFFINVKDNDFLDQPRDGAGYAVFGKVVDGHETIEKIRTTEVETHPKYPSPQPVVPVTPVVIEDVKLLSDYDHETIAKRIIETRTKQEEMKKEQLEEYIRKAEEQSGNKVQTTESGLRYVVLEEGEGESPEPKDKVKVHYTGWLVDGTKFDSSYDRGQPAQFVLMRVIKGWTEAVSSMKPGGKWRVVIPPELGYGERGAPPRIGPNETLIFDIELLEVVE